FSAHRTDLFSLLLQPRFSPHSSPTILFPPAVLIACAPPHTLGTPSRRFFPQLNSHKPRVRRNHGRLRPNGFIKRARRSKPVFAAPPQCASDKALTFIGRWVTRVRSGGDEWHKEQVPTGRRLP